MFLLHQIVNVLINPMLIILVLLLSGWILFFCGKIKKGMWLNAIALSLFFVMSWPPIVDAVGIWLEKDYPAVKAQDCPDADAIVVLGGGIGIMPPNVDYPYPLLVDAADRVWHGARLWHELKSRNAGAAVKVYCTGPEASRSTPLFLADLKVSVEDIFPIDNLMNTEDEAKAMENLFSNIYVGDGQAKGSKPKILLVTSALHMKRAKVIFEKYAPSIKVIPSATDHHFVSDAVRLRKWQYYFPNLETFALWSSIEHELVGLLRYMW